MASSVSSLWAAATEYVHAHGSVAGAAALLLMVLITVWLFLGSANEPPSLPDTIPFISNTYQYLTNMEAFMGRAKTALKHNNIVKFRLGPKKVYLLNGQQNIQSLFRPTNDIGSEGFMVMLFNNLWGMSASDIAKFADDKSGRLKHKAAGSESVPEENRYWFGVHDLYGKFMSQTNYSNRMAEKYYEVLGSHLERQPLGEWTSVRLCDYVKTHMGESAVVALNGPKILELNEGFMNSFWEFDSVALYLVMGPPTWMNRKPWALRDRYHGAVGRYLEAAWENFDWDGPDADADWDGHFGSRFARELAKWFNDRGFTIQSTRGFMAMIIFGLNSNSIPAAIWTLLEVVKDPSLFKAVREEVLTAYSVDSATGERKLDAQKLVSLPLLQSIFTEILRLHESVNLTREVVNPIQMEGYQIGKGAMLQAITQIMHHDEETWAADGHPASEFWAGRHVKKVGEKGLEHSLAGRTSSFIPFGGGTGICPGRYFAKQEILMTLASIVARFDVEFVEWTNLDGTRTDRAADNDARYMGTAVMPPDKDMRIRWKRLW